MKTFNILDRGEQIFSSKLLEASAGTGKTFTIEHLVIRLLLETPPSENGALRIGQILAVTFTKAAARDLRVRIRSCIEQAIILLSEGKGPQELPDYLQRIIKEGEESQEKARTLLSEALFCFDEAQIFTIHSFCARILKEYHLEGNVSIESKGNEESIDREIVRTIIKDYFRSGLAEEQLGKGKLEILWKSCKAQFITLEKNLENEILKKVDFNEVSALNTEEEIFTFVAKQCQTLLKKYLEEKEILGPDEWLKAMAEATHHKDFQVYIRAKYRAMIIDEFQDTDPLQWTIFENIFLKEKSTCPLYLVGDPKQSIYFFRQADIYTYLKAGESLGKENKASLATNYRSQPSLVQALNVLFDPHNTPGFMPLPRINADLPYTPVAASTRNKEILFQDSFGPVHFIFSHDNHKEETFLLDFMASEIQRLHFKEGIPFQEIAIIIKDKIQARKIYQFMMAKKVPVTMQRASSIGNSSAVDEWREILQAALMPKKLSRIKVAMGNRLIAWNHLEINALNDHNQRVLTLLHWQNLNQKLQTSVGEFFKTFCSIPWKNDGMGVLERLLSSKDGIEHYQAFLQIGEILMEHQAITGASGEHLIAFLDRLEEEGDEDKNENFRLRTDPGLQAVNIMTTHSSKGLEYAIVFAPGLMKGHKNRDRAIPVFHNSKIVLKPNVADSPEHRQFAQELDAEKMRQFYVTLTRAKYRVYLPAKWASAKEENLGDAAPMDLFLARLGQPLTIEDGLYERIKQGTRASVEQFLNGVGKSNGITYQILEKENHYRFEEPSAASIPLITKPEKFGIPGEPIFMHSFTSLAKKAHSTFEIVETAPTKTPPHDFYCPERTPHTLPSGSETGNLIHLLFEKIPFPLAQKAKSASELIPWLKNKIAGSLYKDWESCLADILFQTFHTPLKTPQGTFKLAEIDPNRMFREIEFLYPAHCGFLKGKIDCIIEHNNHHYILDWKSNWLGESAQHYSEEALNKAMQDNQYDLQARIYAKAWELYVRSIHSKPFETCFKGAFYIFVRGPGAILLAPEGMR